MSAEIPNVVLSTGASIPQLGLGTWPLNDAELADAVVTAAELGYRHVDTATKYGNEAGAGEGVRRSGMLLAETGIVPAVNQVQISPAIPRETARAFDAVHGIVTESWSPLGGEGAPLLASPTLAAIGAKYGKSPAQVVLRWHVQNGLVAIPKSATPARMADNLAIFDFELDAADLAQLADLSEGPDAGVDSDTTGH